MIVMWLYLLISTAKSGISATYYVSVNFICYVNGHDNQHKQIILITVIVNLRRK